jgi:hypothetical protein
MILPKIWPDPPIVINVSRQAVEVNYTKSTLDLLWPLVRDPAQAPSALGRLRLVFDGYENDSRKLWHIPEARLFIGTLDWQFPYWHFLADLASDTLYIVAACVCAIEDRGGVIIFNKDDLLNFAIRQFGGLNELVREWKLSEEEESARSEEVARYFTGVQVQ